MSGINWGRGFDRLAYVLLGLAWVLFVFVSVVGGGDVGRELGHMVVGSLIFLGVYRLLRWAISGFFTER